MKDGKGPKGKGKGRGASHEYGKGSAPSWGKAAGKGSKGGPKGSFKGAGFVCNRTGHRAADCTMKQSKAV
jgi:hypothetical protein